MFIGALSLWTCLAGCATSPLDRAAQDRRMLLADVSKYVDGLVAEANRHAAATLDGRTFHHLDAHTRVMFFVPAPGKPAKGEGPGPDNGLELDPGHTVCSPDGLVTESAPPPNAVRREWTDRFARAHQYTISYGPKMIERVVLNTDTARPFEARVTLKVTITSRVATVARSHPVPQAPEGMKLWRPDSPLWRFFGVGPARWRPRLEVPTFASWSTGQPADALSARALAKLEKTPSTTVEAESQIALQYDVEKGSWRVTKQTFGKGWGYPRFTRWEHGLPESRRGIYSPSDIKSPEPATKPATK